MEFEFRAPTRLIFGEGKFGKLGEVTAAFGKKALLVSGTGSLEASGHVQRAREMLEAQGVAVTWFRGVTSNPTTEIVDRGAAVGREAGCDVVVALGGGSVMDAAKAMAVGATHDLPIRRFMVEEEGAPKQAPTERTLPVICATSTAGTSSELTPFAVLTIEDRKQKSAIRSDYIQVKVAIEDPELTYTVPAGQTAATGVDVLCHALESFVHNCATPVTDLMSQEAIRLVGKYLPRAVANGHDVEARQQMMLANTFAGYGLASCGATVMHGLEHPVSAHYPHVAHGAGLAAMLRPWAKRMANRMPEKLAAITRLLAEETEEWGTEEAAEKAEEAIGALLQKVSLDIHLSDLGVEAEKLPEMAQGACDYMAGALASTPGDTSLATLMEILEEAL
ncbi:MAG: iron-containing alcohol dehydrogenase [Armatimonadia bacterium]